MVEGVDALQKKIAHELATTITTARLPTIKTEVKTTSTRNSSAVVPEPTPPRTN